jgi:hypothetical protein
VRVSSKCSAKTQSDWGRKRTSATDRRLCDRQTHLCCRAVIIPFVTVLIPFVVITVFLLLLLRVSELLVLPLLLGLGFGHLACLLQAHTLALIIVIILALELIIHEAGLLCQIN